MADSGTARPRSLRDEQKQYTREQLIAAGLEVFQRKGYVKATVEDIAAAAGASRATFYLHFNAKADIARELVVPLLEQTEQRYEQLAALEEVSKEALRAWLDETVALWERNRASSELMQQIVSAEPQIAPDAHGNRVSRSLDTVIDFITKHAGTSAEQARVTGALLFFQLERFCFFWTVRELPPGLDREQVVDTLAELWWDALRPA